MRRPKYRLNEHLKTDEYEFHIGTEIQVFWNEGYVPSHLLERLDEAKKYNKQHTYMCLIGKFWIPLTKEQIREDK